MKRRSDAWVAAGFLAPFFTLFTIFTLVPVVYGFWMSLHNWHILAKVPTFIGLRNYAVVVQDDRFWQALSQTGYFVLLVVPAGNLLSLMLAIGLNQRFRGETVYRVMFYLPVITSIAVLAVIWRWLYAPDYGLINQALGQQIRWLDNVDLVIPALALMTIWWGAGGNMLVYLAALKAVPAEILEAASLDGSTAVHRFFKMTLPTIRPAILFCVVLSVIASFQVFGQSYILTNGGPADRSLTVALYMYQMGFGQYQLGYASAVSYVLFAVVLGFTLIQFRVLRRSLQPD
ncbi:MAG: carbohydrate ABC transporter permease [Fimbriimonas sp.]